MQTVGEEMGWEYGMHGAGGKKTKDNITIDFKEIGSEGVD
jgi:hypothetical protein